MSGPCIDCKRLHRCAKATSTMVELGEGCNLHEKTPPGVFRARMRFVDEFGSQTILKTKSKHGELSMSDMKIQGHVRWLRGLAVSLGAIEHTGASFRMKEQALVNKILDVTDEAGAPLYPNIADMNDANLQALIKEIKGTKGAGAAVKVTSKKAAPKKAAPKKTKEAVEAKTKTAPKEETPEKDTSNNGTTKVKAAAKKKTRAAPKKAAASTKKKSPTSRRTSVTGRTSSDSSVDSAVLTKISDMIEAIGTKVFDGDKAVADLSSKLDDIEETITAVSDYLTWSYNQQVDEGNEISSLTEVNWE